MTFCLLTENKKQKDNKSITFNPDGKDDVFYKWFLQNYFPTDSAILMFYHLANQTSPIHMANSLKEFVPISGAFNMTDKLSDFQVPFVLKALSGLRYAKGYFNDVFEETIQFIDDPLI